MVGRSPIGRMEDEKGWLAQVLVDTVNEISAISDFRQPVKKLYLNMARRLMLLTPMFEEIKESKEALTKESMNALMALRDALNYAKEILMFGSQGSKIYLVLEREKLMTEFHEVTAKLEKVLSEISYEKLDISDEVKEQVDLVRSQFKRAKGNVDTLDDDLYDDVFYIFDKKIDDAIDAAVLRRVTEKLQLQGVADLTQESLALHEMVFSSDGDPGANIEKMCNLLKKIKDFVQTEHPILEDLPEGNGSKPGVVDVNTKPPEIPDDFRCPISLELMKDPVIVSTGQTYERSCIEKWLESGHRTCPKTQQPLENTTLTPNYVLRSLIAQWCEANGIEPPRRPGVPPPGKTSASTLAERTKIESLLLKLTSRNFEDQLFAVGEIRLLAKRNADNRIAIAEAGAIPLLVELLTVPDSRIQEHAVTALLNLSICEVNKGCIVSARAIPGIVHVLKKGSMEARENAAATLFSLSVVDENKIMIGAAGAITPLVILLSEGTQRGKKDAATALFNLCIFQGNKSKAVRAGIVPILMQLLTEPEGGMVDEALAIMAILASHSEGKIAIGAAKAVPVVVEVIGNGSPRNKENAAAILVHLSSGDPSHLVEAQKLGVMGPLIDLAHHGTDRGKRKAKQLLERINRYEVQHNKHQAPEVEDQHTSDTEQPSHTTVSFINI